LSPRYRPGEDVVPLVRAVAGGAAGGMAALFLDGALGGPTAGEWTWPALLAARVVGDPSATLAGGVLAVTAAVGAGLLFAYGQLRRFVPGAPWAKGAVLACVGWAVAMAVLLPATATWTADAGPAAGTAAAHAAWRMAKTLLGAVACGAIVGAANPSRSR